MINSTLINIINGHVKHINPKEEQIMVACLLYNKLENETPYTYYKNIKENVGLYENLVKGLKDYYSYENIKKYIKEKGYEEFPEINFYDYQIILRELTFNKRKKMPFTTLIFNRKIYMLDENSEPIDVLIAQDFHDKVMCSIFKYYKNQKNIDEKDIIIDECGTSNISDISDVAFHIANIDSSIIINDLFLNNIVLRDSSLFSVSYILDQNKIKMIINKK